MSSDIFRVERLSIINLMQCTSLPL